MSQISTIIFDLDGTLVDAFQALTDSLNYAFEKTGNPQMDIDTVRRSVGWGENKLLASFVQPKDMDRVMEHYREHHAGALQKGVVFLPGVKDVLAQLHGDGYRMCVATNRPSRFTRIILEHLQVDQLFQVIVCADQVARPKPEPDMLFEIMQRLSLCQKECLYVGDMTVDVETGRAAGIKTVAVTTGSSTREDI
ncbi:MAG: HAD family hydrolase, partial [Candidatus Omnitrophica bacterium]|nr:HAD family hydrolase [Candidatus Omnitrophota bacterium]